MLFNTLEFWLFFVLVLTAYLSLRSRASQNVLLLMASYALLARQRPRSELPALDPSDFLDFTHVGPRGRPALSAAVARLVAEAEHGRQSAAIPSPIR